MKKVFLLLASALMGVAAFAGNTWELTDDKEVVVAYNPDGKNWQAGNKEVVTDAMTDATSTLAANWKPALGESITFTISGIPSHSGKFQFALIDESPEADWYTEMAKGVYIFKDVVAGEKFELSGKLKIDNVSKSREGHDVELLNPAIVLGFAPAEDAGLEAPEAFILTNASYGAIFEEAEDIPEGTLVVEAASEKQDSEGHYKYEKKSEVENNAALAASAKENYYINFQLDGKADCAISTLMLCIADNSPQTYREEWWNELVPFAPIATNIAKDQSLKGNYALQLKQGSSPVEGNNTDLRYVLLILTDEEVPSVKIADFNIKFVSITEQIENGFSLPNLSVEEVSNVAFENGVIYSSSIVVYNQAGQVVATASDEFAINTLKAGIYFAKTAEGSISFVVK